MSKRNVADSIDKLKSIVDGNKSISVQMQTKLMKQINSIAKHIKTPTTKEKRAVGTSQFEKKMLVSDEMCRFAGWPLGSVHSRVEITKAIWDYVKANELREETNKRICKPTEEMKRLMGIEDDTISYPRLQKFIGKHFVVPSPVAVV